MLNGRRLALLLLTGLSLGLGAALARAASPLGIGTAEPSFSMGGPFGGVMLWINTHQQAFYQSLTTALRDMRSDPMQLWSLIGLSFAYGVFHAAGPGHGKAVISSYMVANELELKRGIGISIISSILQGIVAIVTVGTMALLLRGSGITLTEATNSMEIASFALVVAFGVWLLARKLQQWAGRRRLRRVSARPLPQSPLSQTLATGNATASLFADGPAVRSGSRATGLRFEAEALDHDHTQLRAGEICDDCGRPHLPDPRLVGADQFSLREAWSAIWAVGLRPCSGALLVMTFAMLNGLYLGGILSVFAMAAGTAITVSVLAIVAVGAKGLAVRLSGPGSPLAGRVAFAIEIGGALFIILVGSLLLAAALQGYHLSSA